jgi:Uma2 family endonuclease
MRVEKLPYYSYEDYEHWEDQWELIEGNRVEQPSPTMKHQRIATVLTTLFFIELKDSPEYTVYQPVDYRIGDYTVLQPDMLVVRGEPNDNKYLDFPPALVAEILSPSTAARDIKTKFHLYESQRVLYYLIIAPELQKAEVYQWENGRYVLKAEGRDIHFAFELVGSKAEIDFSQIW